MTHETDFRLKFRTERMDFQPLTPADGNDFLEIANRRAIADAVDFLHYPVSREDIDRLIGTSGEDDCFLGGRRPDTGALVAVVGMHRHASGEIEIGYLVREDCHRQGLATEAAKGLIAALADRYPGAAIVAECHPVNVGSSRLLEALGFVPTGKPGKRNGRMRFELTAEAKLRLL